MDQVAQTRKQNTANRLLVSQPEERGAPGTYLSKVFNLPPSSPIVYLVAPPKEDLVGLDAAFKAPDARIAALTVLPSQTNYLGVIRSGDQPACQAARRCLPERGP